MRTRIGALLTVLVTVGAVVGIVGTPGASAQLADEPFDGYGSGTVIGLNAVQAGGTTLAATNVAHSGGSVDSQGLEAIADELGQNVAPGRSDKNAYGRGAGVQIGVGTPVPSETDRNQINLAGLAQALAPPPEDDVKSIPVDLTPVLSATTATGQASALYHPDFCPVGKPFTFGEGEVENLQVLNPPGGSPLISSTLAGQNVSESRTVTYAIPNGDGTFGLVSETRMTVAPIAIGPGVLGQPTLSIEIVGPIILRVIATGKPGGADVQFSGTPLVTIKAAGVPIGGTPITLGSIVGPAGLNLSVPLIANLNLGAPPHAIGQPVGTPVEEAADGTSASASVDVLKLQLLPGLLGQLTAALDLRVGHLEGAVTVPQGGFTCRIPVSKQGSPDPVVVGEDITFTVRIPSDPDLFTQFFGCDLVGITAVDVHEVESGNPTIVLRSASRGGRIEGNTVTWDNLGDYRIGDPPIELTIVATVTGGAGVLRDIVDVSASLGNCRGTGGGSDIVGQAINQVVDTSLGGTVTLIGPRVNPPVGRLAATGGDAGLLVLGAAFLLGAIALRRHVLRPAQNKVG